MLFTPVVTSRCLDAKPMLKLKGYFVEYHFRIPLFIYRGEIMYIDSKSEDEHTNKTLLESACTYFTLKTDS